MSGRLSEVEREVGPPVPIVVAARDVEPATRLRRADLRVRWIPRRFAPADAPSRPEHAIGLRTAGSVAADTPITAGLFAPDEAVGVGLRRGQRAIEIAVAGGPGIADTAAPGSRADILVSTEPSDGPARTFVALEDVEVLGSRPASGAGVGSLDGAAGDGGASALVTFRVTLRQAVYLAAADSFAREIRLLPRPAGDRRRIGRATISADGL